VADPPPNDETALDAVLLIFAKSPEPGSVKTRLAGEASCLTPDEAAEIYTAFLADAVDQYTAFAASTSMNLDLRLCWSGPASSGRSFTRDSVQRVQQRGQDLGERMWNAFEQAFTDGYRRVVVIGTDHPTLPDSRIQEAFDTLDLPDRVVIGPSEDGGYYLLGMNRPVPEVFADMTYSHPHVFKNTLRRAAATGAQPVVLSSFYDVDTPSALRRMLSDLSSTDVRARRTREIAVDLRLRERLGL